MLVVTEISLQNRIESKTGQRQGNCVSNLSSLTYSGDNFQITQF